MRSKHATTPPSRRPDTPLRVRWLAGRADEQGHRHAPGQRWITWAPETDFIALANASAGRRRLPLRYVSLGLTKRLGAVPNMRLNAWPNALGDW